LGRAAWGRAELSDSFKRTPLYPAQDRRTTKWRLRAYSPQVPLSTPRRAKPMKVFCFSSGEQSPPSGTLPSLLRGSLWGSLATTFIQLAHAKYNLNTFLMCINGR
jgi:hypothetical protein